MRDDGRARGVSLTLLQLTSAVIFPPAGKSKNLSAAGGWSIALRGSGEVRVRGCAVKLKTGVQDAPVEPPADASPSWTKILLLKRTARRSGSREEVQGEQVSTLAVEGWRLWPSSTGSLKASD